MRTGLRSLRLRPACLGSCRPYVNAVVLQAHLAVEQVNQPALMLTVHKLVRQLHLLPQIRPLVLVLSHVNAATFAHE